MSNLSYEELATFANTRLAALDDEPVKDLSVTVGKCNLDRFRNGLAIYTDQLRIEIGPGAMKILGNEELKAVLTHELGHLFIHRTHGRQVDKKFEELMADAIAVKYFKTKPQHLAAALIKIYATDGHDQYAEHEFHPSLFERIKNLRVSLKQPDYVRELSNE